MNNFQEINDLNDIDNENLKNMNNLNDINNNNMNVDLENLNPNMDLNQGFNAGYEQEDEEGVMNQNINGNNIIYDNNNNDYEEKNQMLLQHVNEINQKFSELERDFKSLEIQNQQLKMQLKVEQSKNKNIMPNDIKIYENSINQGKIFLEDIKKKNAELKKKIKELEEDKNSLNYKLIEANQRIKRLENDYNVNKKENEKNSENVNSPNDDNNELVKLKNKIDELEIVNSKLTLENTDLKKKMANSEQEHNKQLKLITNYKNSELTSFQNVLMQYKQYFKNHNINPKLNKPNVNSNNNNNLDYGIMVEMSNKDKIIKSLNAKVEKYISEYKNVIDEKQIAQQKCNQILLYNQKILSEKNDLIKNNQNLKMEIADLNQKIEMNKTKYKNHKYIYENNMIKMQAKLAEYKQKVITLKLKINEMLGYNPKHQMKNQNSNINLVNKKNLNNFEDIKKLTLTPTQKKIIPGNNSRGINLNKKSENNSKIIGNKYFPNNI